MGSGGLKRGADVAKGKTHPNPAAPEVSSDVLASKKPSGKCMTH